MMPAPEGERADAELAVEESRETGATATEVAGAEAAGGALGAIRSRADAIRAIDRVCEYLERAEPTNPAQLLLRRARRLISKDFLQLIRELAPEALGDVAKIMGVSADSVGDGSGDSGGGESSDSSDGSDSGESASSDSDSDSGSGDNAS
jgi:type VI secretion system protein ImpA